MCLLFHSDLCVFNYVNKKLKKVICRLFKLQKYSYLCRMNYSISLYTVFSLMQEQFQISTGFGAASGANTVVGKVSNRAYPTDIKSIVCFECRNV